MVAGIFPNLAIAEDNFEVIEVSSLSVEEQINYYSILYSLDPVLMKQIAWSESRYNNVPNYKYDGENGRYTAYGIFQITRTTYNAFCGNADDRKDITKNIECAMKIAKNSGVHHWNESRGSWGLAMSSI